MRRLALVLALTACEQTDPSAASQAGGAVGAAVHGEQAPAEAAPVEPAAAYSDQVKAPRDAVTGFNTGKRLYKPTSFTAEAPAEPAADAPTPALSGRDVASGLPTGKRQHKPSTLMPD